MFDYNSIIDLSHICKTKKNLFSTILSVIPKKIEHGVIVKERFSGRCIINMYKWTGKKYGQEYNILSNKANIAHP
jgi:hypothetical protein